MSAQAMDVRRFKRAFWDQPLCYLWATDGRGWRVLVVYRNRAELRRWLTAQSLIRRAVRRGAVAGNGIDKALAATYASDDGTEYSHSHRRGEGEPDCPACWVHDIRAALTGAAESHGERPPGPGIPADPVSGGTVQHSGRESGPDA